MCVHILPSSTLRRPTEINGPELVMAINFTVSTHEYDYYWVQPMVKHLQLVV